MTGHLHFSTFVSGHSNYWTECWSKPFHFGKRLQLYFSNYNCLFFCENKVKDFQLSVTAALCTLFLSLFPFVLQQCFSTLGLWPHVGSPGIKCGHLKFVVIKKITKKYIFNYYYPNNCILSLTSSNTMQCIYKYFEVVCFDWQLPSHDKFS